MANRRNNRKMNRRNRIKFDDDMDFTGRKGKGNSRKNRKAIRRMKEEFIFSDLIEKAA